MLRQGGPFVNIQRHLLVPAGHNSRPWENGQTDHIQVIEPYVAIMPLTNVIGDRHITVPLSGLNPKETGTQQVTVTVLQIIRSKTPGDRAHPMFLMPHVSRDTRLNECRISGRNSPRESCVYCHHSRLPWREMSRWPAGRPSRHAASP